MPPSSCPCNLRIYGFPSYPAFSCFLLGRYTLNFLLSSHTPKPTSACSVTKRTFCAFMDPPQHLLIIAFWQKVRGSVLFVLLPYAHAFATFGDGFIAPFLVYLWDFALFGTLTSTASTSVSWSVCCFFSRLLFLLFPSPQDRHICLSFFLWCAFLHFLLIVCPGLYRSIRLISMYARGTPPPAPPPSPPQPTSVFNFP